MNLRAVFARLSRLFKPNSQMPFPPNADELAFIKAIANHRELAANLARLGHVHTSLELLRQAEATALCWFRLGKELLLDAQMALQHGHSRATYSRAYYAAYNSSKALRYYAIGRVSLKGDDHGRAGADLPDDFPDVDLWSGKIGTLLEYRQRADYDNWSTTQDEFALSPNDCFDMAKSFIDEVAKFFDSKFGVKV